jgi:hypothetical protein
MLTSPKLLLHLEGLLVFAAAIAVYSRLGDSWLTFALLFFVPDVFMLGYLSGVKTGAAVYNLGHTYATPFLLGLVAWVAQMPLLFFVFVIWIAHIGFDRLLGYGLKYPTAFKDTHLGRV